MGIAGSLLSLLDQPYYLNDKEFDLFVKMVEHDIPYFLILAIRHSDYKELLSRFVISDIKVADILPGNKYGIYFDYREMKIEEGYKEIVERKVLNSPECRNELSEFSQIRKWKVDDGYLWTKEGYDRLLDFNDNYHLRTSIESETLDSFTEKVKRKFDYAFNFDLALYNKGVVFKNLIKYWNLEGVKFLYQFKHFYCLDSVSNLMKKLTKGEINRKEFDCIYGFMMKDSGWGVPELLLPYLNGNLELLDEYHFGFTDVYDNTLFDPNGHDFYDDIENQLEELEEYCKNNGFDDNRRKKYILDKILQELEMFKKSPAEMEKEKAKKVSNTTKAKPTKTLENRNVNTSSAKPMDSSRAEILKNLIKNNVDKSVLLASGFSEEEINEFMKPVDELLLNLIKNGVSDEILTSSGYSIHEINECKKHL